MNDACKKDTIILIEHSLCKDFACLFLTVFAFKTGHFLEMVQLTAQTVLSCAVNCAISRQVTSFQR